MKEIRCKQCNRFLCAVEFGIFQLKCPNSKCKALNSIKVFSYKLLLTTPDDQAILKT